MVNRVPRKVQRPKAAGPKDFWPRDFLKDSFHLDTPNAFPKILLFWHPELVYGISFSQLTF